MNPQKKMVHLGQKLFNPSQSRSNGLTSFNKETFNRAMIESINKAINSQEGPPKEKHVRKLLIGTFQAQSGGFFFDLLPIQRLKENPIVCWKFCHVLHRMLRDGHRKVVDSCYARRQLLLDCGNMWRHVDGYGQLIFKYCTLLFNRTNFLVVNSQFPNDLKLGDQQLDEICERNIDIFFEMSCEMFDALEDILRLQELVLITLDIKKHNSMTTTGQSHLAPLVCCIQDSSLFYDYLVKILFRLHGTLSADHLIGHRDRFLVQHKSLKNFYSNTSNLQYFKTLIQIPHLTDRPPNFLIASDLNQHVAPQAVMIANLERDSPEDLSNDQLLVNFDDEPSQSEYECSSNMSTIHKSPESSISQPTSGVFGAASVLDPFRQDDQEKIKQLEKQLTQLKLITVNDNKMLADIQSSLNETIKQLELSIDSKREELAKEKLLSDESKEELSKQSEVVESLKNEIKSLNRQIVDLRKANEKLNENYNRALHDNDINHEVIQRMMKELTELKRASKPEPLVEALNENLEQLLTKELNETDRIIREASNKIQELSEKSRKVDSGIKLEVNEKISDVCSGLMEAVVALIVQSRALQNEIVTESVNKTSINCADFYKRNSSWTEGLISAAKIVATAAKSLVDSSDRVMSGKANFSELAAAAHEIAAATTQLMVASRVKARRESDKLKGLSEAAKQVNLCTGNVVAASKICAQLLESSVEQLDISSLSLHQTKKLEMESQVRMLELESLLDKERVKLGMLRKRHYEQDATAASNG